MTSLEHTFYSLINSQYYVKIRYYNPNKHETTVRTVKVLNVETHKNGNITVLTWDINKDSYRRFTIDNTEILSFIKIPVMEQVKSYFKHSSSSETSRKFVNTIWYKHLSNVFNFYKDIWKESA